MISIKTRFFSFLYMFSLMTFFVSCKKEPGEGGRATIKGNLYADNFYSRSSWTRAPMADERVYLVYGNAKNCADNDIRTGYDGSFEFNFLRKGKYKLFAYSLDTNIKIPCSIIPVVKEVEIKQSDEVIDISDFVIYKDANQSGSASIKGKLFAKNYNSELTQMNSSYYLPDEYVYLVFGNSDSYGVRTKTNSEGTYVFSGLRQGSYRVYSFSKDLTKQSGSEIVSVFNDLLINDNNQAVTVPDLIIIK